MFEVSNSVQSKKDQVLTGAITCFEKKVFHASNPKKDDFDAIRFAITIDGPLGPIEIAEAVPPRISHVKSKKRRGTKMVEEYSSATRLVLALGLVTLDELPTLVADPERVAAIGEAARQLAADKTPVTFRSTERVSKGGQVFIGIDLDSVKIKA